MTTAVQTHSLADGDKVLANPKHELFCQLYISQGEFFGDGVEAYLEAFDVDQTKPNYRRTASASASRMLKDASVLARVNYLLENLHGLNDAFVDKQLSFLIIQSADLRSKLGAIREFNALKGRIKRKLEIEFSDSSDAELDAELEATQREIAQAEALLATRRADQQQPKGMPLLTPEQVLAQQSREAQAM